MKKDAAFSLCGPDLSCQASRPLQEGGPMSRYPLQIKESRPGIYIHVPFCAVKCPYCNFYSVKAQDSLMDAYTEKLCRALELAAERWVRRMDSLYLGGGTPILLGPARIEKILNAARRHFSLEQAEITLEANPASTLEPVLRELYAAGVNRLSFGLQSADEGELRLLGRRHTAKEAALAVEQAQRAGFSNLSLDLMLGLPQQSVQSVEGSVAFCAKTGVSHISAYLLKVEPGTPFDQNGMAARCPDADGQADLYLCAVKALEKHGFFQYEISNFAKPGFHSRHNCKCWLGTEYLGLGPAAHSLLEGRRRFFPPDLAAFLSAGDPLALMTDDGPGGGPQEFALLGLRLAQGVSRREGAAAFPDYDWAGLWQKAEPMVRAGYMGQTEDRIFFTPEGFLLSNTILARIL